MKYIATLLLLLVLAAPVTLHAQDEGANEKSCTSCVKFDYGVKFKSRHVWNGHLTSNSWTFQPNLNISFKGFYFNVWSYSPIASLMTRKRNYPNDPWSEKVLNTEIDFTLGFAYGPFSIEYYDFFYIDEQTRFNKIFRWSHDDQGGLHQQWCQITFSGVEKFPVMLTIGAFTFGDYMPDANGDLKPWYTMYIGAGYSHMLSTGQKIGFEIGGSPYKGFLTADGPNICNVKFSINQPVRITDKFGLNLGGEVIFNPVRENAYFVFSASLL